MEDFGSLEKIVVDFIQQSLANNRMDMNDFFQNMEVEFKRLGFRDSGGGAVDNILLIRWDNVGDFLLTTPAIREVRRNYPNAFITLLVLDRTYNVAEFCPYVNEVLKLDEKFIVANDFLQNIFLCATFAKKYLWRRRYELAFTFRWWDDGLMTPGYLITYLSGARERVGYLNGACRMYMGALSLNEQNLSKVLLTHPVLNPPEIIHDCARSLYLIQAYGLRVRQTEMEVWYNKTDLYEAKKLLGNFGEGRVKVFVAVGATTPARSYPVEKYLVAFKEIIARGASIIILGGSAEVDAAKFLEDNLPTEYVKNFVPVKTGWRVDTAMISMMDMYIGNDTGTKHLAAALKKPIVVLCQTARDRKKLYPHIPTETENYQAWHADSIILEPDHPLSEKCGIVGHFVGCTANEAHCIAQITPAEIVAAYEKMVSFMRDVRQVRYPPIIKSVNQVEPLMIRE